MPGLDDNETKLSVFLREWRGSKADKDKIYLDTALAIRRFILSSSIAGIEASLDTKYDAFRGKSNHETMFFSFIMLGIFNVREYLDDNKEIGKEIDHEEKKILETIIENFKNCYSPSPSSQTAAESALEKINEWLKKFAFTKSPSSKSSENLALSLFAMAKLLPKSINNYEDSYWLIKVKPSLLLLIPKLDEISNKIKQGKTITPTPDNPEPQAPAPPPSTTGSQEASATPPSTLDDVKRFLDKKFKAIIDKPSEELSTKIAAMETELKRIEAGLDALIAAKKQQADIVENIKRQEAEITRKQQAEDAKKQQADITAKINGVEIFLQKLKDNEDKISGKLYAYELLTQLEINFDILKSAANDDDKRLLEKIQEDLFARSVTFMALYTVSTLVSPIKTFFSNFTPTLLHTVADLMPATLDSASKVELTGLAEKIKEELYLKKLAIDALIPKSASDLVEMPLNLESALKEKSTADTLVATAVSDLVEKDSQLSRLLLSTTVSDLDKLKSNCADKLAMAGSVFLLNNLIEKNEKELKDYSDIENSAIKYVKEHKTIRLFTCSLINKIFPKIFKFDIVENYNVANAAKEELKKIKSYYYEQFNQIKESINKNEGLPADDKATLIKKLESVQKAYIKNAPINSTFNLELVEKFEQFKRTHIDNIPGNVPTTDSLKPK